ncbi:GNAT family N-acetyltransferase [Solidesulfovibrio sp.]
MDRDALIVAHRLGDCAVLPDQDYAISLISPQDALGVARLTYSVYGDQHPFDYVYDPSEIARLYASGTQYAVVAKSSQADVLGMIGIYRCSPWPRLYELAQLMILKNQRSKGMARDLWLKAMELLPDMAQAGAIFGEAVCTHTFSQRMCETTGMLPCGIAMDAIPSRAYSDEYRHGDRTSLVLSVKPVLFTRQTVHLPAAYRAAYVDFCARAGLDRQIEDGSQATLPESSRVKIIDFEKAACIKVWVHEPGRDLEQIVSDLEGKAGDDGIVQAIFDLGRPDAPAGIEALNSRGYYFGGFMPYWFETDALMLQRRSAASSFQALRLYGDSVQAVVALAERDQRRVALRQAGWGEAPKG